jgi:hypothetical protein
VRSTRTTDRHAPDSSATPARQGRRSAARCSRPCRAALDRRARSLVGRERCAGRATPIRSRHFVTRGTARHVACAGLRGAFPCPGGRGQGRGLHFGLALGPPAIVDAALPIGSSRRTSQRARKLHRPVSPFKSPAQRDDPGYEPPTIIPGAPLLRVSRHGCGQGEGPIAVLSRAFQR